MMDPSLGLPLIASVLWTANIIVVDIVGVRLLMLVKNVEELGWNVKSVWYVPWKILKIWRGRDEIMYAR